MNIAVIGGGGREHALALKLFESSSAAKVFCIPGNPGTAKFALNRDINPDNYPEVYRFVTEEKIDLVVIGPEKYLCEGLSDFLREKSINVFGPSSSAARIESDKGFAKNLMIKYRVPTASFCLFNSSQIESAQTYCNAIGYPVVIKATGLAAGKGVVIVSDEVQALSTLTDMFENKIFGEAGESVVIEEFMKGEEASVFAVSDGENFVLLPAAQDHKRIGDNDTGKNTGGMGAYAPAPVVTNTHLHTIETQIVRPILDGLRSENVPFSGCLFCGLMISGEEVKVVEFNARFGDPETQAIMGLIDGDFAKFLFSAACGKIDLSCVSINSNASVCVVAASQGYPDQFTKGYEIGGINAVSPEVNVYQSGTVEKDGKLLSNGGRVLGVTSIVKSGDLSEAIRSAYEAISKIHFNNIYYRKDIGAKGLRG